VTTAAIVHPINLLGKELRETLGRGSAGASWQEVRLISTHQTEIGTLTEVGGAATVVQPYEPGCLDGVDVAFCCGPIAANRPILDEMPAATTAVVLSPDASPADGPPVVAGINLRPPGARVLLSPHPATVMLAHLLHPLADSGARGAVATVVQPASLQDEPGLEDLFDQTRQIVAMTPRRRSPVFGGQLAFNLMPAALAEAAAATIATQLAAVVPRLAPAPAPGTSTIANLAVQLVQGGIFHCLTLSLYLPYAEPPGQQAVRKDLAASPYVGLAAKPRLLGPIDAAASDKVLVGSVRADAGGVWIWAVMDNLTRGGALNALEIAAAVH
jgi:aspartate-semialdehyde dehydrogenase